MGYFILLFSFAHWVAVALQEYDCQAEPYVAVYCQIKIQLQDAAILERRVQEPNIDKEIVDLLERLSLVQFNNLEAVDRLNKAVQSANQLNAVNTDNVEPIDSVLEDRKLYLREDTVMDGNCLNDILKNASKTIEDYYVAPPGNIPLKQKDRDYGNDYSTNQ